MDLKIKTYTDSFQLSGLYFITCSIENVEARQSRSAHGGDGTHVGRVCGRLHGPGDRRVRHAAVRHGGQRRGRGPRVPGQDVGHVEADGEAGDGGRFKVLNNCTCSFHHLHL